MEWRESAAGHALADFVGWVTSRGPIFLLHLGTLAFASCPISVFLG